MIKPSDFEFHRERHGHQDRMESVEHKGSFPPHEREASFRNQFFIQLIQQIESKIDSIKSHTQISRGKFSDKEFSERYYRAITEGIEKIETVLSSLISYAKLTTPIGRTDTVHNIVEEVLQKHQFELEEKGIKLLKRFEKNLPETIVPDEQLRYILSSVLQYAMTVSPPSRNIAVSTRSLLAEKGTGSSGRLFKKNGKYVEVSVIFSVRRRRSEPGPGADAVLSEEKPDILLRFVRRVVLRNHGIMKIGTNKERTKNLISFQFPVERRKAVYDRSMN